MKRNTDKIVKVALFAAIALILRYIEFPILPTFAWLQIDLSDVPALIAAFGIGPMAGVIIELIKNVLILVIKGTTTGGVGDFANFFLGVVFILPPALLYKRNKSKKTAIIGMILGALTLEVLAPPINIFILLPAFGMKMTSAQALNYTLAGLIPFNAIKSLIVSVVTYVIYKRVSVSIFKNETAFSNKKVDKKTETI
ncbi:ECF transporter S component [Clostridium sp. BJN0001]|uniref:ECF transporter S component n=1 Tax=Clostridium sp. BJN0001 TaxID=2930219 RepID=UPI001FD23045|nr:ECF transporter S component [Clostridium sp. BJN0001]